MVINVHAGHNPDGKTAYGAVGLIRESTEARLVKNAVIDKLQKLGNTVYDCTEENGTSQNDVLTKIVKKCNAHSVDLDVSIHFNSGRNDYNGDGSIGGSEVWIYPGSTTAQKYAEKVVSELQNLGFKSRGVKTSNQLYFLNKTKASAILIEVCFVDDKDDTDLYIKRGVDSIANAIVKGITGKEVNTQVLNNTNGLSNSKASDGNWYYYTNGKVNTGFTGLAQNKNGWWYINKGKVDFSYTGLAKNENGWWYVEKGKITFEYNGLATNQNGTWYCRKSKVDFDFTGNVTAKVSKGKVIG